MRAIWSGAISFGLVNIPIKLYSATSKAKLDLDMLDPSDLSHIRYKRVNEETGKEVPWDKIVKGYEYEDGNYVLLSEEELAAGPSEVATYRQWWRAAGWHVDKRVWIYERSS